MLRIVAQRNVARQAVDVHVLSIDERTGYVGHLDEGPYSDTLAFNYIEQGSITPAAAFALTEAEAQSLIDDLYRAGLRPTDARGTAGQLDAMKAHLEDMRRLAGLGGAA